MYIDHYAKKCSTFFLYLLNKVWVLLSLFRYSLRNKAIGQSASPSSSRLLYDDWKRQKRKWECLWNPLCKWFFYLFFRFPYFPVNNCYHISWPLLKRLNAEVTDFIIKVRGTMCSSSREQRKITPPLVELNWVIRGKNPAKFFNWRR